MLFMYACALFTTLQFCALKRQYGELLIVIPRYLKAITTSRFRGSSSKPSKFICPVLASYVITLDLRVEICSLCDLKYVCMILIKASIFLLFLPKIQISSAKNTLDMFIPPRSIPNPEALRRKPRSAINRLKRRGDRLQPLNVFLIS